MSAIDELIAKQAITEVIYRYCRALDRMDRELALSVWHDDGVADYGPMFNGTGAGFIDWVWQAHQGFAMHSHQITNVLVEVDLGADRAASEAYVTVTLRTPAVDGTATEIVGRGRYVDRWSRRAGRWAIDQRRYLHDIQTVATVAAGADSEVTGRRGRDDPSYAVLR